MKFIFLSLGLLFGSLSTSMFAQPPVAKIGVINIKKCLETSKLGKQEQTNFEKMKNQMEDILEKKGEEYKQIEAKLNDDEYMDSLSDDAVSDLRHKKRKLQSELMQLEKEFMETLRQLNMRVFQKLTEQLNLSAKEVAVHSSGGPIHLVLSDEACPYYDPSLDISQLIIQEMDKKFDAEVKDKPGIGG